MVRRVTITTTYTNRTRIVGRSAARTLQRLRRMTVPLTVLNIRSGTTTTELLTGSRRGDLLMR